MNLFTVEVRGETKKVWAQRVQGDLWVHADGQTYVVSPEKKVRRGSQDSSAHSGLLTAPMPGKILKVQVGKGDQVAADQDVIVLEAMKMEYSLRAPFAGQVQEVNVQEGEQVSLGQTLVAIANTKAPAT